MINFYKNNLKQFGKTDIAHISVFKSGEKGLHIDFLQEKVTLENINKHAILKIHFPDFFKSENQNYVKFSSNFLRVAGGSK